jgi:hypothetical protein
MNARLIRALAFAAVFGAIAASSARADDPRLIDIKVSINATKSVTSNTTSYNFTALSVNTSSVSSRIVITNDSTSIIETYRLMAGNAISDTNGTDWTLNTTTGTNQYALAAQFASSQPANTNTAWSQDEVSGTPTTCTVDVFGDGTPGDEGVGVLPTPGSNTRDLYFRVKTPDVVTDPGGHTILVTLSVL